MPTFTTLSGIEITYAEPDPESPLGVHLARIRAAVADPSVTMDEMTTLVYGPDNPLMRKDVIEGWGYVDATVNADPIYKVMRSLLHQKRLQVAGLDLEESHAQYTVTVSEAATQLGISSVAVRKAITEERLAAIKKGSQYRLRPTDVHNYTVRRRGPAPTRPTPTPEVLKGETLSFCIGNHEHLGARIRHDGQEVTTLPGQIRRGQVSDWTVLAFRYYNKERNQMAYIEVVPTLPSEVTGTIKMGPFFVSGRFRIAVRENNPRRAGEAWKGFRVDREAAK